MRSSKYSRGVSHITAALAGSSRRTRSSGVNLPSMTEETIEPLVVQALPDEPLSTGIEFQVPIATASGRKRKRKDSATISPPSKEVVVKVEETEQVQPDSVKANGQTVRAPRRKPARRIKDEVGNVHIEPPSHWEEVYDLTKQMRETLDAPVDTMGCERLHDLTATPEDQRFQILVSLMLSSQTKDTVTAVAVRRLQSELPGSLTIQSVIAADPVVFDDLIGKVGFHNTKTKHIKQTAAILRDQFKGDIPDTIEGLVSLPGVGPKMAHLTMSAAWGRTLGIGVDVHVHRITNLWGWHKTTKPEETRKSLEAWLPHDKWHEINHLLVGFGQTRCLPVGRKCGDCVLAEKKLCPGSVVKRQIKKEAKIEVKIEDNLAVTEQGIGMKETELIAGDLAPMRSDEMKDAVADHTRRRGGRSR